MSTPDLLHRFQGCVVGLAVGDALGYPVEFQKRSTILDTYGPDGVTDFVSKNPSRHPPGTFSDDTQMTVALAEGLLEAGFDAELDPLMEAIGRRFVQWSRSPDNDRAPGNTCMRGCGALARGVPWREAGVADSKGCGSAMRVAPIGLVYHDDVERLLEIARASSLLTHGHDAAVEGAAAGALLVAMALRGESPSAMYEAVMARCAPYSADLRACFAKLPDLLDAPIDVALSSRGLGEAWVAEEAVASALWCYWRHPDDFAACVLTAANTDGDSDSIACIAGSIAGAALGLEAIATAWRDRVEEGPGLHDLGHRLHARASRG